MVKPISEYRDIEDWVRDVQREKDRAIEALKAVSAASRESKGVGLAEQGMIRAEMNPSGVYEKLVIDDAAFRFGPTRLAAGVLTALREAHNAALRATREAAAELVGIDAVDKVFTPTLYPDPDDEILPYDEDEEPDPRRRW